MEKRKRGIKKQVWLNEQESSMLSKKAILVGMTESDLLRNLIKNYEPKEKPDDRFYDFLKQLRGIAININQIARFANYNGFMNEIEYKRQIKQINNFIDELKEEFLFPRRVNN